MSYYILARKKGVEIDVAAEPVSWMRPGNVAVFDTLAEAEMIAVATARQYPAKEFVVMKNN